jgi:hypothetical protein
MRIEEVVEGKRFVKLIDGKGVRVFLDGEEQRIPELQQVAAQQGTAMLQHIDVLYGLITGHLFSSGQRMRTRDGVDYHAVRAQFDANRGVSEELLLYVHPTRHRVERYDVYGAETMRLTGTVLLSESVDLGGLPFATRARFLDREKQPVLEWRFEEVVASDEPAPERFQRP